MYSARPFSMQTLVLQVIIPCVETTAWFARMNRLMKGDMKYYRMFGREKVIFDKEVVDQMKKFDQPGMRYACL